MTIQLAAARAVVITDLKKPLWIFSLCWLSLPALGCYLGVTSGNGIYFWLVPIGWFAVVPMLDTLLPRDEMSVTDEEADDLDSEKYYRYLIDLAVPMVYATLFYCAWTASAQQLSWLSLAGMGVSFGIVFGNLIMTSRAYAHGETRSEHILYFFATAIAGCGYLRQAQTIAHQQACATSVDPLSARMGENLYKFILRSLSGSIIQAWRLERRRLASAGPISALVHNEILQSAIFLVILYAGLISWVGSDFVPVLLIALVSAWFFQSAVSYIQHYGLLRRKRSDGGHVRVASSHSWNGPCLVSGLLTFHAVRHADTHVHPGRRYQSLRADAAAPTLPCDYPAAILLAVVPPLWFRSVDQRVARWAEGDLLRVNIDGEAYANLMARYHRPGG